MSSQHVSIFSFTFLGVGHRAYGSRTPFVLFDWHNVLPGDASVFEVYELMLLFLHDIITSLDILISIYLFSLALLAAQRSLDVLFHVLLRGRIPSL